MMQPDLVTLTKYSSCSYTYIVTGWDRLRQKRSRAAATHGADCSICVWPNIFQIKCQNRSQQRATAYAAVWRYPWITLLKVCYRNKTALPYLAALQQTNLLPSLCKLFLVANFTVEYQSDVMVRLLFLSQNHRSVFQRAF